MKSSLWFPVHHRIKNPRFTGAMHRSLSSPTNLITWSDYKSLHTTMMGHQCRKGTQRASGQVPPFYRKENQGPW